MPRRSSLILLLLGGGLYAVIHSQLARQLDDSLRDATQRAGAGGAHPRNGVDARRSGDVVDAVDELHIPDRALYLLDSAGTPIKPAAATHWIRAAARRAAQAGSRRRHARSTGRDHIALAPCRAVQARLGPARWSRWRSRTRSSWPTGMPRSSRRSVAPRAAAIVLVTAGGYFLVQKSTAPGGALHRLHAPVHGRRGARAAHADRRAAHARRRRAAGAAHARGVRGDAARHGARGAADSGASWTTC